MLKIFSRNFVCFAFGDNKNRADKNIINGKKTIKSNSPQSKAFQYGHEDSFYNNHKPTEGFASHAYSDFASDRSQTKADKNAPEMKTVSKQQTASKITAAFRNVAAKARYGIQKGFKPKEDAGLQGAKKIVAKSGGAPIAGSVKESSSQPRQKADTVAINKNAAAGGYDSMAKLRATEKTAGQQAKTAIKSYISPKMQKKFNFELARFNKAEAVRQAGFANKETQRKDLKPGVGGVGL